MLWGAVDTSVKLFPELSSKCAPHAKQIHGNMYMYNTQSAYDIFTLEIIIVTCNIYFFFQP